MRVLEYFRKVNLIVGKKNVIYKGGLFISLTLGIKVVTLKLGPSMKVFN